MEIVNDPLQVNGRPNRVFIHFNHTKITSAPNYFTIYATLIISARHKSLEDIHDEYRNENVCSSHCRHSLIALMSTHEGRRMMKVRQRTFQI